ncbi:MAG: ATP-dependent RecD-like DNA helicase [Oscillospiraceae bacterium]|jgi:exodeoxyribonuclease V alpha subunit|nr:ATP-dependent RecD-like DNA helicase [Oscillospiraceae bacterium]
METIDVLVKETVFRNEENGYSVLSFSIGDSAEKLNAVGSLPLVNDGERLSLTGEWVENQRYGRQFRIHSCVFSQPSSVSSIEKLLASGWVKGIGPSTAKLVVQAFGMDTMDILQFTPERLATLPGIGKKRAAMIAQSYQEKNGARDVMISLQGYGIPPNLSMKIFKVYGDKTNAVLRENPYRLVEDVRGIGFKTADEIASKVGIQKDSPFRVQAGILYVLKTAALSDGHCCLPRQMLYARTEDLLSVNREFIDNEFIELVLKKKLALRKSGEDEFVYLSSHNDAELEVAAKLVKLKNAAPSISYETAQPYLEDISRFEISMNTKFDEVQREAVLSAIRDGTCVITGGPGTGKTTIIRCILNLVGNGEETVLAAPTGRAAKRMTDATGREAKTIHRLLEYGGDEERFLRNEENPLECKTIIVDETSMVDIFLMRALLRALSLGTRLILVGDADQLPSVGPGNVLHDVIGSGIIATTHLVNVYRQSGNSLIAINAHKINHGEMPTINDKHADFFLERRGSAIAAAEAIVELHADRLPRFMNMREPSINMIQVLSPMKKGDCGVIALNSLLQARLNPKERGKPELMRGENLFRKFDKVMQTRNDYNLEWELAGKKGQGVFNGDMGIIEEVDTDAKLITVKFDDDRVSIYELSQLDDLSLAYCVSVHKSQGSEFPIVLMPVVGGPPMLLTRNLLYTAVTRAKQLLVLVGREDALAVMVNNINIEQRFSFLAERLREMLEKTQC